MIQILLKIKKYLSNKFNSRYELYYYLQDLISEKTGFTSNNINVIQAWKSDNKSKELDNFIFLYNGVCYYIDKNNKLSSEGKKYIDRYINNNK